MVVVVPSFNWMSSGVWPPNGNCDVSKICAREALGSGGCDPVLTGCQKGDAIVATFISVSALGQAIFLVRGGNGNRGNGSAIWIRNATLNMPVVA